MEENEAQLSPTGKELDRDDESSARSHEDLDSLDAVARRKAERKGVKKAARRDQRQVHCPFPFVRDMRS